MTFEPFKLEHFFARWEFVAPHVLCASDAEGLPLRDLLPLADEEAARLWVDLKLSYTETLGHPLLRAEIARLYDGVRPDDVVVFSGAQEPIFVAMTLLLGRGDHAVVVTPAYQSLYSVAEGNGAEVTKVPLQAAEGWRLDPARIARALTPRTRVVVLNVPNSPTGSLPDHDAFAAVAALAAGHGITLFCDEVYRWLEYDSAQRLPAGVETSDRGISLGVMSKAFGLAGLRIGWIACRDAALRERLAGLKHYTTGSAGRTCRRRLPASRTTSRSTSARPAADRVAVRAEGYRTPYVQGARASGATIVQWSIATSSRAGARRPTARCSRHGFRPPPAFTTGPASRPSRRLNWR